MAMLTYHVHHRQTLDFQDLATACSKKGARDVVSAGQELLMDRIRALGSLLRSGGVTVEVRQPPGGGALCRRGKLNFPLPTIIQNAGSCTSV